MIYRFLDIKLLYGACVADAASFRGKIARSCQTGHFYNLTRRTERDTRAVLQKRQEINTYKRVDGTKSEVLSQNFTTELQNHY
jgi:hypothetical protein